MKGNYHLIPNCIYDDDFSVYEIAVYGYLARCANKSNVCFPSRKDIAKKCNISVKSVDKSLKNLEEYGYISKLTRRRLDGTNMSNLYTLEKID